LSAKIIPIGKIVRQATDLGTSICAARKHRGLTQAELAARAKVGLRFLSELENGKPTVQFERVLRVLDALDLVLGIYENRNG
jgi:HTH-type transcriptional regulator/antitoxin HipB